MVMEMSMSISEPLNKIYYLQTYDVGIFSETIRTTVTFDGLTAFKWMREVQSNLSDRTIVGFHVEYYVTDQSPAPVPATLQLCTGNRCLIYQLPHSVLVFDVLTTILTADKNITLVGVGINRDMQTLLRKGYLNLRGGVAAVELGELAAAMYGEKDCKSAEVEKLASRVLGIAVPEKPRHVRLSRWDKLRLEAEQVQYACVDAFLSFKMGDKLDACNHHHHNT